jgi:hypothetical protein
MMPRHDESFKNVPVSAAGIRQGFCGAYVWCAPLNKAAFFMTLETSAADANVKCRARRAPCSGALHLSGVIHGRVPASGTPEISAYWCSAFDR